MIRKITFESHWLIDLLPKVTFGNGTESIELTSSALWYDGETGMEDLLNLETEEEIIDFVTNLSGAWSLVLYRADLNKIFVGRDIFGRQSLVYCRKDSSLLLGCAIHENLSLDWYEVPFAQVTSWDIVGNSSTLHYLIPDFEEEFVKNWKDVLNIQKSIFENNKVGLVQVSREVGQSADPEAVDTLFNRLIRSCSRRKETNAENGVAFSGGVDSLLVAHALLQATSNNESITLINVAFGENDNAFASAPDRKRSVEAFTHLTDCYPDRQIRLVLRNVTGEELKTKREQFIARAAAPCMSVLDDSLACVVWFALEGKGNEFRTGQEFTTGASVFFVGSGADEIFAGYARHRNRFQKDGHPSVAEECQQELRRLGSRNGGRDSRVATQLQRTLVAPFLTDEIVRWANELPILQKCDLSFERGVGEKRIIRQALMKLNAPNTAPKQAMQFGSRIAKLTNESKTVKGSDVSSHLQSLKKL
ncbi:unnamed protein product [Auanema sp. JU1783]|nr:unnamed protein product [Auanema sp. JU1783]